MRTASFFPYMMTYIHKKLGRFDFLHMVFQIFVETINNVRGAYVVPNASIWFCMGTSILINFFKILTMPTSKLRRRRSIKRELQGQVNKKAMRQSKFLQVSALTKKSMSLPILIKCRNYAPCLFSWMSYLRLDSAITVYPV